MASLSYRYSSNDKGSTDPKAKSEVVSFPQKLPHEILETGEEESHIEWSNLIFLPFHPVFQMFVLFSVITKTMLGPLHSVYPIVYCWDVMDDSFFTFFIKNYYLYVCDTVYGIDTVLHMIHRQVTDKAMRREYMPKSAFLLLLDLLALIPLYGLMMQDICPPVQLWPNLLAYNEFLIVYRVWEYFNLVSTHSYVKLILGFTVLTVIMINGLATFWILLTYEGLCANCKRSILDYDWRAYVSYKLNETDIEFSTYVYAACFVTTHALRKTLDAILPSSILEIVITCLFMLGGYTVKNIIVVPKAFSESILRLLKICTKYPSVKKIIEETKRRNPSPQAYQHVETYYTTMWRNRSGIVHMPDIMDDIPRYLRLEIKQDLLWPIFYHSPTLRKTSNVFKRWLSETVHMSYKLPGEKFYGGSQCLSNLYYLKSGVVQLISTDDGTTPILSVTSGTIIGDINFILPHRRRKVTMRCLTYCEVYFITRYDLLRALHKFPDDRKIILNSFKSRINHAKALYACKQQIKGLDRNEDEGIAWIKRRWWEIFDTIGSWKKKTAQKEYLPYGLRGELPPEESSYHCAKYIGQLVLCTDAQLQTKSIFINDNFPWILSPYSIFVTIWKRIVVTTVFVALCTYPPHIILDDVPPWFQIVIYWTNMVYVVDIFVSLSTAMRIQENESPTFVSVIFERCKSFNFILDVLSTIWIELIVILIGYPSLYYTVQFNRLIKIYVLFSSQYMRLDIRKNPRVNVYRKIILLQFTFVIIVSNLVYEIHMFMPDITMPYFFGDLLCTRNSENTECVKGDYLLGVAVPWTIELIFPCRLPLRQIDIFIAALVGYLAYILAAYCKGRLLAYFYLKHRAASNYEYFVLNLKKYYQYHRISKDLLKRLERYLLCHFKYHKGADVMHPDSFKHEPFEIYWKVQGEVAEKIIGDSIAFTHANPALIRELTCASKYVIIPRNATLFLFGTQCRNVTWIVQGYVRSESYDHEGELVRQYYEPGDMLSASTVLFKQFAVKTYTTCTECEILYIKSRDFFNIYKRYPVEWQNLKTLTKEFLPDIEDACRKNVISHKEHQAALRDKLSTKKTSSSALPPKVNSVANDHSSPMEGKFLKQPESKFMQTWLLFRVIIVLISITNASLKGSIGAQAFQYFDLVGAFCDCIGLIDIILKFFLAYYDHRGLLITDKGMCIRNYLTKGFVIDIVGTLPWFEAVRSIQSDFVDDNYVLILNTCSKFAHIYIVFAYFDYISDLPTGHGVFIKIIKWQVVNILIALGASHYLFHDCVFYIFDEDMNFSHAELLNGCWIPDIFEMPETLDSNSLHLLFVQSLNLAVCGMLQTNLGGFTIDWLNNIGEFVVLFLLGILFWFVSCYTLILLVLGSRENRIFQHGVNSLKTFLTNERVEKTTIDKAIAHFRYCWMRTKGINIQNMSNERIGVVFRQDLTYFFYRKTYAILDTLLMGGEAIQRQLASVSSMLYFLPGHEIMREMDLVPNLYVVHRGRVILKRNGRKVITLTKGDIFGQLIGTRLRPVKISAESEDHVDVLELSIKSFQEVITNEIRKTIAQNIQSKSDFLATKTLFVENPIDTVQYLLRGKKAILLPWMYEPKEARHGCWYTRWLHLAWFCGPCITAFIVIILPWNALPISYVSMMYCILIVLDMIHLAHFIGEFYSAKLTVENNRCVKRIIGLGVLRNWGFYVDALSLFIPILTLIDYDPSFQLAKLLRLKWFIDFEYHFCQGFKSKAAPRLLKTAIFLLLIHLFTCGWIYVACSDEKFPFHVPDFKELNASIDFQEWTHPDSRIGGCARATNKIIDKGDKLLPAFVVPVNWAHDYIVALTFILLMYTRTGMDIVMALTTGQLYYKMFITYAVYLLDLWLLALGISAVYTRVRQLYQYDYHVGNLTTFLKDSGLCKSLTGVVWEYTKMLWRKQKGNWLPELTYQGPVCLREDLFVALYIHHLDAPSTFRQLPFYFKRQLAARLERTVIFPGKCIAHEGDVFNITYFIHEGEVEKWYKDASGERKMMSLLYTNGYFGCLPGLFVNSTFQFSYYSRTVVDLVYLRRQNWADLIAGYPDIMETFYESTKAMKQDALKAGYRTSKCIAHEGDVFNITYFIHEGEVEKWYKDASGERKMMSLLYTNGYFGCLPGLFVNSTFQFSYYSRTVVDLVYLRRQNWADLIAGYPDIMETFYESTKAMKQDALKAGYRTS